MGKILKSRDYQDKQGLQERLSRESKSSVVEVSSFRGVVDREVLEAKDQAEQILAQAQEEAKKIKAEAQEILDQVKAESEKAREQGRAEGHEEGLENVLEMLLRVKELRAQLFQDNEAEMIRLVFAIAKKVVGREFSENDKAILNVIRLAINDAVGEKLIVKVNPKDYEKIKKNEKELLGSLEDHLTVHFREDEHVEVGGCIVDTEIGTIDAQLETQLRAIKKALRV